MKSIVLLLTHNRLDYTKLALPSIYESFKKLKNSIFLIYDDSSTDGTLEYITNFISDKKNMKVIQGAYGNGYKQVEDVVLNNNADYLFKFDNDVIIPDCLPQVLDLAIKNPEMGVLGFRHNNHTFNTTFIEEKIFVETPKGKVPCGGVGIYRMDMLKRIFPINLTEAGIQYAGFQLIRIRGLRINKVFGSWIRGLNIIDLNRHTELSRVFEYEKKGMRDHGE